VVRRQIPRLEAFVREKNLLDRDASRPLIVRETPPYMRGVGAGASVSAPGPLNPTATTYYNVTPLDGYAPEEAESLLREYNDWTLQILNIHEAIPGHYTQLVHANKSGSLVKSLFANGSMIEGWAVYGEKMMLDGGEGRREVGREDGPHAMRLQRAHQRMEVAAVAEVAVHEDDRDAFIRQRS
jgi:uncharacterized protein (DUF885 family)